MLLRCSVWLCVFTLRRANRRPSNKCCSLSFVHCRYFSIGGHKTVVNDETDTQRSRPVFGWCAVLQTLFSCLPSGRPWLFCFIAAVLVYSASHSCISPSLRDATCRVDYLLGSLWHWEVSGLTLTPGACSFYNLLPLDQAACRCYTRCSWMVTLADIVICLFTYMSSCSVVLYYI